MAAGRATVSFNILASQAETKGPRRCQGELLRVKSSRRIHTIMVIVLLTTAALVIRAASLLGGSRRWEGHLARVSHGLDAAFSFVTSSYTVGNTSHATGGKVAEIVSARSHSCVHSAVLCVPMMLTVGTVR